MRAVQLEGECFLYNTPYYAYGYGISSPMRQVFLITSA